VLVVCVGAATRLIEYVQRMPKVYRTVVRLGARSDTLDHDGHVVETVDPPVPSAAEVHAAVAVQVGTIAQVPPQFSALKVAGQRAYDLARAGRAVELAPREVTIERIDVLSYAWPRLELEVACGGGTYIRSIARDVGEALGCGGLVEVLVRTRIGTFALEDAVALDAVNADSFARLVRPAIDALGDFPRLTLTAEQVAAIAQGRTLEYPSAPAGEIALIAPGGTLAAIAEADPQSGRIQPRRVLL
jgi:tRNA pseudouridine55 synthase